MTSTGLSVWTLIPRIRIRSMWGCGISIVSPGPTPVEVKREAFSGHAMGIDVKDPRRIWQGNDGGLAVTYDGGHHWEQINNIPLGQFYHVSADSRQPFYNVTVGMQDNGIWTGPSRTREPAGIFNDDW